MNPVIRFTIQSLFGVFFLASLTSAFASDPRLTPKVQIIDGLAIYLGIIPAEMIEGHIAKLMHGGLPVGTHRYHISVAIFDNNTGNRIHNSVITVRIASSSGTGPGAAKQLEEMTLNKTRLYGNYFSIQSQGPYIIDVTVTLKGKDINARFKMEVAHT